jgi:hypothetical protein
LDERNSKLYIINWLITQGKAVNKPINASSGRESWVIVRKECETYIGFKIFGENLGIFFNQMIDVAHTILKTAIIYKSPSKLIIDCRSLCIVRQLNLFFHVLLHNSNFCILIKFEKKNFKKFFYRHILLFNVNKFLILVKTCFILGENRR